MQYYELISTSLDYIETNIEKKIGLNDIADAFNVSKYYYHRLFSALMGSTLNDYIQSRKMNYAIKFMKDSKRSLTEIAYDLGFSDQSSFTRTFKKVYNITPKQMLASADLLAIEPIPEVVIRPIKNLNGDIITDFTLVDFTTRTIKGVAFEVDLANPEFKDLIRSKAEALLDGLDLPADTRGYMIYSNCKPNSSVFNALFGIEMTFDSSLENVFTVSLPEVFCAKFNYTGDLLEIGDIFATDFARFLRVSRLKAQEHHIELIQAFSSINDLNQAFEVYVPIEKLPIDHEK